MRQSDSLKKLKSLAAIKPRPDWQLATRAMLLDQVRPDAADSSRLGFFDYLALFSAGLRRQMFQPAMLMLLVLGTFLGSSLVVNAAFYSLPGSSLYRVKLALERAQVAFTPDEESKLELKIEFARKRVEEVNKLASSPDLDADTKARYVHVAVQELKRNVVEVAQHVDKLAALDQSLVNASDRQKTLRIATAVQSQATELAKSLDEKTAALTSVESNMKDEITDAVKTAEQTSQLAQDLITSTQAATSTDPTVITEPSSTPNTENASTTPTTQSTQNASSTSASPPPAGEASGPVTAASAD